jgi:DNA-binding YbaB/EbfC family protein
MSFPLALSAVATTEQDAAWLAGGVYAANTVGAIIGSLAMSFVLVPWIGSSHSEQVLIIASALSALILLEPSFAGAADAGSGVPGTSRWNIGGTVVLALAMVGAGLLARSVHPLPGLLVAYGRYSATRVGQADIIYVGEGLNASVAVSQLSNGVLNYHNAGKVQASSEPQDMRLQRMLGHLTTLLPPRPRSVMVIGFGAGATAGAASIDPAVLKSAFNAFKKRWKSSRAKLSKSAPEPKPEPPIFMSSIGKLMKQAARMQQQMEQVQADLASRTVEATSGGGAVKVIAKCDGSISSIKIDPQALNPADAQLLEDMVLTAANQALAQAKEISNSEMGKITSGLSLPGMI